MTDLLDDVKASFQESRDERTSASGGPITVIHKDEELVPGFNAMRSYYEERMMAVTRRGYRHFAGSTMPDKADELVDLTSKVMTDLVLEVVLKSFSDGVIIGHREDHLVKMCYHFNSVAHLYHDSYFRKMSNTMASGFAQDDEVRAFFVEYIQGGINHLSHATGFAHQQVDPGKIWDVWMLIGTATTCAAFLAGNCMGSSWRERDVLDGIAIATEDSRGSEGEAAAGDGPVEDGQDPVGGGES